jgi:hypothetical protein
MNHTFARFAAPALTGFALALGSFSASADTFSFESVVGTENSGIAYTGTFDVTGSTLTLSLTLDPNGVDGFLTGIVLNEPAGAITGQTSQPTGSFEFITGPEAASPYGNFDVGSALGGDFLGGSSPNGGVALADGATAEWTFSLASNGYSAADFWEETCTDLGCFGFVARFRGLGPQGEDSDKVPAVPIPVIPEPQTYALMLAGLGLVGWFARRRRTV